MNILNYNDTPLPECDGFTPYQMHTIIYFPFSDECPIKVNLPDKELILSESPIFKLVLELLSVLDDADIKLTQKGNLPVNLIKDIYAKKYSKEEFVERMIIKIHSETDWTILHTVKIVIILAGLAKKVHNRLSLTKTGKYFLIEENYPMIFIYFLETFCRKFNWAHNDGFENNDIGRIGFLYSLHILKKYGGELRALKFYSDSYFSAFPAFDYILENAEYKFNRRDFAYHVRFVERFAKWFGFAEVRVEGDDYLSQNVKVKRTKLLEQFLRS